MEAFLEIRLGSFCALRRQNMLKRVSKRVKRRQTASTRVKTRVKTRQNASKRVKTRQAAEGRRGVRGNRGGSGELKKNEKT